MGFIGEEIIEKAIANFDDRIEREGFDRLLEELGSDQPYLLAYLTSESHDILTDDEKEYLLFLGLVLWLSFREAYGGKLQQVEPSLLEEIEEEAWETLQESKSKIFSERIDSFFEHYLQEDLLAFVEDTLVIDEDSPVTVPGRDPLFIAGWTILEGLNRANSGD